MSSSDLKSDSDDSDQQKEITRADPATTLEHPPDQDIRSSKARRRTAPRGREQITLLIGCMFAGVGLALLTGPDGNSRDLWLTFRELPSERLIICLALAFGLWLTLSLRQRVTPVSDKVVAAVGEVRGKLVAVPTLRFLVVVGVLAGAILIPPQLDGAWRETLVTQTGIYVLLAIGLNVVVGWAGLLDLGYIAFFAIGAYTTAYFTGRLPVAPPFELSPFYIIPFAVGACLLAGVLLGAPTLRLRGDYLAIVTLGFGEIVRLIALNADDVTNGSRGAPGIPHPSIDIGPINYQWNVQALPYWYLLLIFICLATVMFSRLERTRIGRTWAAIREDEVAARASGVRTVRFKLLAFAIGASTSGVAGVMYASKVSFINPENFLLIFSFFVLAYVIFGGMGSLPGVILGAAVLTLLPEYLRDEVPPSDLPIYLGVILVLMMIYRPAGLLPARRRQMELVAHERPAAEPTTVPAAGAIGGESS